MKIKMWKIWKETSYRSGNQKERENNEWASQPEKLYVYKVEELRPQGLSASLPPCALYTEMWARHRAPVPLWKLLSQTLYHVQGQTQLHPLCASTYGQTLKREHFKKSSCTDYASPTALGNALEIHFEKYFRFCSCLVAVQTMPNVLATHC